MKNNIILLGALLISSAAFSQVGIDTDTPKATLDIKASPTNSKKTDGLIAPRLTGNELKTNDGKYGADQTGAIVYATEAASPTTAKTINVTEAGYFYFDGAVWQKFAFGTVSASNGTHVEGSDVKLGGALTKNTVISDLSSTNKLTFQSTTTNAADAYFTVKAENNTSGGVYLGNPSHGVTRGFPTLGGDNNVGLYTTSGNLYLSTNGKQVGEFVLADNGNVGIGLGTANPTTKLHVNAPIIGTGFRLVDGSEGDGKILVSDANGNASWDFAHKAHLITLTAANTSDITIPKHPNTITVPGLDGFTAPATGKYMIYYHSFLQADNNSGDKAFYFEVLQNGTKIKEPESYAYVSADKIMAVNVPVIIDINEGDAITFRWRDGLTFPAPVPSLTFRTGGHYMTRNFIEILYIGK